MLKLTIGTHFSGPRNVSNSIDILLKSVDWSLTLTVFASKCFLQEVHPQILDNLKEFAWKLLEIHLKSKNSLFPRGLWTVAWEMLVSFVSTEVQFKNTFFYSIVTVDLATAKDLLLLANTVDEQKQWVQNLSNKIEYRSSANSTGMRASKK